MVRVDKETLFYPLNTNTEKIKVLVIYLKPPSSKVLIKRSLPVHIFRVTFEILSINSSVSGEAPKQFPRNVKGITGLKV